MAKKKKKNKGKGKKKSTFPIKVYLSILLILSMVFLSSTLLFLICMLPSLVAIVIDRHPQRSLGMTVSAMNFAGLVPFWLDLLEGGHSLDLAYSLIFDPFVLMVTYSAAGFGWALYFYIPPFVATIIARKAKKRLEAIKKEQEKLKEQWGIEVATMD